MDQSRLVAIVLAAGMSQRMGRLKPLLPFGDRPMLARVVENLIQTQHISSLLVITGHAAAEITQALTGYPVTFVHNPHYATGGMLSSVQTGVRALPENAHAFLLVLGDQPMVASETLTTLITVWQAAFTSPSSPAIALPTYDGRRGHPVLFSTHLAAEILALSADETLRTCVTRHASHTLKVPVNDPAILADIDTPEDYEQALRLWEKQNLK